MSRSTEGTRNDGTSCAFARCFLFNFRFALAFSGTHAEFAETISCTEQKWNARVSTADQQDNTRTPEGFGMRLKRISLVAVILLVLTGCSAKRHARESDAAFREPSPVTRPMRHADEFNPQPEDSDNYPERSDARPTPSPVPMREPVPAPPAIGVSRVKSVSWLQGAGVKSDRENCAAERCGDGYIIGRQSELTTRYFSDSCTGQSQPVVAPSRPCREKLTMFEIMRGWKLRSKVCRPARVRSQYCSEPAVCDSGCSTSEGCVATGARSPVVRKHVGGKPVDGNSHHSGRGSSLADPIHEFGWENPAASDDARFSPDELLDLQSEPHSVPVQKSPPNPPPQIPSTEAEPLIPMPATETPSPALESPRPPVAAPPQSSPNSVKRIVQPPLWPRLNGTATKTVALPQSHHAMAEDSSLPIILPGRGI